jgi:hypothetical protein
MAQRAPQQTPKHEREQQWVRVAVIGAGKVGKTNLITRLAQDEYAGARASKSPLPPVAQAEPQPSPTSVKVCGRIGTYSRGGSPPNGYCLIVDDAGSWYISNGGTKGDAREQESVIATGKLPAAAADAAAAGKWLTLSLKFAGTSITPSVDGTALKAVTDSKFSAGMVGVGSGWNTAWFDDLAVAK